MEKFSIYDLLGLLLPGFVLVFLCHIINSAYKIIPYTFDDSKLSAEFGIMFCMSLLAGAFLYAVNFYLFEKYKNISGMYKGIGDIYANLDDLPDDINSILNVQANHWYHKPIFFTGDELASLEAVERREIFDLQDKFYSKAYYELEYLEKISVPKTFQSFYFFFRQLATGLLLVAIILLVITIISWINIFSLHQPDLQNVIWLWTGLIAAYFLSVGHARWYRKNMVFKLFWHYYIHLIKTPHNGNNHITGN